MPWRVDGIFHRVVNAGGGKNGMGAEFVELRLEILGGDVAAVTGEAIPLLIRKIEQARAGSSVMRGVTAFAAIRGYCVAGGVRPGIIPRAVPGFGRDTMGRVEPEAWIVTLHAQSRGGVVLNEEFSVLVVVGVMA